MNALAVYEFEIGRRYVHGSYGVVKALRLFPVIGYLEAETLGGDVVFVLASRVVCKEVAL